MWGGCWNFSFIWDSAPSHLPTKTGRRMWALTASLTYCCSSTIHIAHTQTGFQCHSFNICTLTRWHQQNILLFLKFQESWITLVMWTEASYWNVTESQQMSLYGQVNPYYQTWINLIMVRWKLLHINCQKRTTRRKWLLLNECSRWKKLAMEQKSKQIWSHDCGKKADPMGPTFSLKSPFSTFSEAFRSSKMRKVAHVLLPTLTGKTKNTTSKHQDSCL